MPKKRREAALYFFSAAGALAVFWVVLAAQSAEEGIVLSLERVSVANDGSESTGASENPDISADGRFVAFQSSASNLVPGDTNRETDIFVRDRKDRRTIRVSVSSTGEQAVSPPPPPSDVPLPPRVALSSNPSISGDGMLVAFESEAPNLVPGDTNGRKDVFVHNLEKRQTIRVSVSSTGIQGNGDSTEPDISPDGRFVAFTSQASNLVPGDTNSATDIFVHDLETRETFRVSVASDGTQANDFSFSPSINDSGQVAFVSLASNLVLDDTNEATDIFVHDLETKETIRVSISSDGREANGFSFSPSTDGVHVAFKSDASNLVRGDTSGRTDIFVRDIASEETIRVSVASDGTEANSDSDNPAISGRAVVFESLASNLVPNDTNGRSDIFVHLLDTGETFRVSVLEVRDEDGQIVEVIEGNGGSLSPVINAWGDFVAFESLATNLVPNDTNGKKDIFVAEIGFFGPAPAPAPHIAVSSEKIDFGKVKVGKGKTKTLEILNEGEGDLQVFSVESSDRQFAVISPAFPQSIPPGESLTVKVRFKPRRVGRQHAVLLIESNDQDEPVVEVKLVGRGISKKKRR